MVRSGNISKLQGASIQLTAVEAPTVPNAMLFKVLAAQSQSPAVSFARSLT